MSGYEDTRMPDVTCPGCGLRMYRLASKYVTRKLRFSEAGLVCIEETFDDDIAPWECDNCGRIVEDDELTLYFDDLWIQAYNHGEVDERVVS